MIIPSKHSGYQAGIRLYPGGGGDAGGGGGGVGVSPDFADSTGGGLAGSNQNAGTNNFGESGLLGNGRSGLFGPVNTGGLSGYVDPSGARPGGFDGGGYGSDNTPVIKPISPTPVNPTPVNPTPVTPPPVNSNIYKSQYQNYARPSTQFSTSLYGTQPMNSPAFNSGMSRGNINQTIENFYQTNPKGFNADASSVLDFMRSNGLNREDFQARGGLDNYGPQMSMPQAQTQQPFNPYTNSSQPYDRFYGGQQQSYSPPLSMDMPNPDSYSGNNYVDSYSGRSTGLGGRGSYQAPQQQQYNPFSYGGGGQQFVQPQMNNPFSYQPQQQQQFNQFRPGQSIEYPQQQQFNPYRQYEMSLGAYNPYQQQQQYNPFSYQPPPPQYGQPQYGQPYQSQQDLPQYSQPEIPTSSGPSQAIYGRSSAMRGTPNVMRRAEGGIAGILKK